MAMKLERLAVTGMVLKRAGAGVALHDAASVPFGRAISVKRRHLGPISRQIARRQWYGPRDAAAVIIETVTSQRRRPTSLV